MAEKYPKSMKDIDPQIQEVRWTLSWINTKKIPPRHTLADCWKLKKEKKLKAVKQETSYMQENNKKNQNWLLIITSGSQKIMEWHLWRAERKNIESYIQ